MKSNNRYLFVTLSLGLGLTLALLWLMAGETTQATAAPARRPLESPGSIITVCLSSGCDYTTVQDALDGADPGDTIKVAGGTYTGVQFRAGITQVAYISETVTVRGGYTTTDWTTPDPVANPTVLDAEGLGRVLVISGTIAPTVEHLHLTGGDASGLGGFRGDPTDYDAGAGVYVYAAAPTISGCVVYSNVASTIDRGFGGGMYLGGVTALNGNTLQYNVASTANLGQGGGIYIRSSDGASLSGNTLLTNTASTADDGSGGGVFLHRSDTALTGNIFRGNVGSRATNGWGSGGGLYANISDVLLTGNTFRGNAGGTTYSAYGGGIYLRGAEATLEGNWIIDNAASQNPGYTGRGGGVYVYKTRVLTLTNNVVGDNYTYSQGSGLFIDSESTDPILAYFLHNTIANNSGNAAGLHLDDYITAQLTNTILAGHSHTALRVKGTSTATLEATLWHGNGSLTYGDGTIISSTNVYSPPGFVDPATWDYHLTPGSAAIDAGVHAGVTMDIDGEARPSGSLPDLGADETPVPVITLTKSGPSWFNPGEHIVYTLRITNTGLITGHSVILTDALAAGSSFAWAGDGGLEANGVVTWPVFSVPPNDSVVTRTFAVTATDTITNADYGATAQSISGVAGMVAVRTRLNHPPQAEAGAPQAVQAGDAVQLDGSGSSDPDGHSLAYRWQQMGGTAITLNDSGAINPTFAAPTTPGGLTFILTITDTFGLSDTQPTTVAVEAEPCAELAAVDLAGPPTVTVGAVMSLTATVTPVNAAQPITYTWEATGQAPVVHTGQGISATVAFAWGLDGPQAITVTATNECGVRVSVSHSLHVEAVKFYIYLPLVRRQSE